MKPLVAQAFVLDRVRMTVQPNLFDDPEPDAWAEVPIAVFLSWSEARRLDYCARRDEDAMTRADSDDETVFLGRRAAAYRSDLERLNVGQGF